MKDHLQAVIQRVRSSSRSSTGSRSSRGSRGSCNIINHGEFKLLVLGALGVGKTTICRRYVGLRDDDDDISVRDEDVPYDTSVFLETETELQQYDVEVIDWNRPCTGDEYRKRIEQVDGYLLVCAQDSKQSVLKLMDIIADIRHVKHHNPPMLILCNKSDLGECPFRQEVQILNVASLDISAAKNEGLQTAFTMIVQECVNIKERSTSTSE